MANRGIWRLFFAILSALIVCLSHPIDRPLFSILSASVGIGLFLLAIVQESKKMRFWMGFVWYAITFGVAFSWLARVTYHGYFILIAYALLLVVFSAQFGFLCACLDKEKLHFRNLFYLGALWVLLEWSRLFLFSGFAWHPVGLFLSARPLSLQIASLFGMYSLSFVVILTNLLFLKAMIDKSLSSFGAFAVAALFPYLFGLIYFFAFQEKHQSAPYRVALVQTGTPIEQKYIISGQKESFIDPLTQWEEIFELMKGQIVSPVDLIVFPEAVSLFAAYDIAFPLSVIEKGMVDAFGERVKTVYPPINDERFYSVYDSEVFVSNAFIGHVLAKTFQARVIMGFDVCEGKTSYSSALHFSPDGKIDVYHKQVLLPIAEYLPFAFLQKFAAKYGIAGFFTPGKGGQLFFGKPVIMPSICYDECFGSRLLYGVKNGAKLLVSVSNDGWFPDSDLPRQHLLHGRIRAIEMGIPMVRACNTGVSAMIDCFGQVLCKMDEKGSDAKMQKGVLQAELPSNVITTPYRLWGDLPIVALSFIALMVQGIDGYFVVKRKKILRKNNG